MKKVMQVVTIVLLVSLLAQTAFAQDEAAPHRGGGGARRGGAGAGAGMRGEMPEGFAGFGGGGQRGGGQPLDYHTWWNDRNISTARIPDEKKLPLIKVQGNKFVDPEGNTVLFRGISISDPDKVENQGHWNKAHFEQVKAMGAKLVRIPVHPIAWRERTPQAYVQLLD